MGGTDKDSGNKSDIPPIRQLQHQRPVLHQERVGEVIVRVHDKKVGSRFVAPLQPGIEIDVFLLFVVLGKGGEEEKLFGSQYFDLGILLFQ